MNKLALSCAACAAGITLFAELTEVSDSYTYTVKDADNGFTAVTEKQTALPSDLPTPAFWFDCGDRTGWEFREENGTNFVTKIPSLVGDRFLTTDTTLPGTTWKGWDGTGMSSWGSYYPPALGQFDDLGNGGYALDFGKVGSRRAMVFDPYSYDDGATTNNALRNIGTVITLYGSQEGGGYILGGGISSGAGEGYRWARVVDTQTAAAATEEESQRPKYWCPLMSWGPRQGLYVHNDMPLPSGMGGMSGTWEAIAYGTKEAVHEAFGLGINDSRNSFQGRSGGMRIAEMMIFDSILTQDQMQRANVYMQQKWLNRAQRGWNGNAQLGKVRLYPRNDVTVELNAGAGETLSVGTLVGGRKPNPASTNRKFVKTGAGTLKPNGTAKYTGDIEVREGTLQLARKSVPTEDELPMGVYVHFDPSDPNSLVTEKGEDGLDYVKTLKNLADGKRNKGNIYARPRLDVRPTNPTTSDLRPWVRQVGLKGNRPIIDFSSRDGDGRYLVFGTNEVMTATHEYAGLASIHTAVAVVRAEESGSNLMNGYFVRSYIWCSAGDGGSQYQILCDQGTGYRGEVYLNGRKIGTGNGANAGGFLHGGYHVIAYRVRPGDVNCIGATYYTSGLTSGDGYNQPRGGVQLGEIMLWNRPLTEEEILDASAYLAKKWLDEDIPGYQAGADATIPDVQEVTTTGDGVAIDVPAGESVTVRKLTTSAPTVKTGAGTLKVGSESDIRNLTVANGAVVRAADGSTVTETAAVAPGATLHLDATAVGSLRTVELNGTNFVRTWYSSVGYEYASQDTANRRPWVNSDADALLNGKPVIDFGAFSTYTTTGRGSLYLSTDLDSVRSVYLVLGSQEGGGNPLGERYYDDGNWYDYLRYGNMTAGLNRGIFEGASTCVQQGEVYTNGVLASYLTKPTGGYQLIEVHPTAGTHVSAIGQNRGVYMMGGFRLGEIIIYERPLSEREKVATRNYLLAKWFPDTPQQELPAEPEQTVPTVRTIDATDDIAMDVAAPMGTDGVVGEGTVAKTGEAELVVKDLSDFEGAIAVNEGTLALTGTPLEHAPALVTEGRILHLDASDGVLTLTNADNSVSVTNWISKLNDGWAATPIKCAATTMSYPTLMPYELNALPVVKMENNGWNGSHHDFMVFHKDGVQQNLPGIKSVFWVIGSQEGGGFVLGGGTNNDTQAGHAYWFHRGGSAGEKATDSIVNHNANVNVKGTKVVWKLNGETINAESTGLSGGYDRLSFVQTDLATDPINADGLAFDGRVLNTPYEDYRGRIGRQRLAELIVYDRIVTDEERAQIEAYLAAKWGFQQKATTNAAAVALAEGTVLEATGNQYVRALAGEGTVNGSVTVKDFTADAGSDGFAVTNVLTIAESPTFTFDNLPQVDAKVTITAAEAFAFEGTDNLAAVTFTGLPEKCRAKAKVTDGKLIVTVKPIRGLLMIIQ